MDADNAREIVRMQNQLMNNINKKRLKGIYFFLKKKNIRMLFFIGLSCTMVFLACDESLPPRNDPTKLFQGIINAKYSLQYNENVMRIEVGLVNIYDETIQTKAKMEGTLDIILTRKPMYHKTIQLTSSNLVTVKQYNSSKNEITSNPGDTIRFSYVWNFIDDNNVSLRDDVFAYYYDTTCVGRFLAYNEDFSLSGSMQILEKVASTTLPTTIVSLCYVRDYFSSHDCPAPPTPCKKR